MNKKIFFLYYPNYKIMHILFKNDKDYMIMYIK